MIGAERTGIRLSPWGRAGDMTHYPEIDETYAYLAEQLQAIGIVYVHLVNHASMGGAALPAATLATIRQKFTNSIILAGGLHTAFESCASPSTSPHPLPHRGCRHSARASRASSRQPETRSPNGVPTGTPHSVGVSDFFVWTSRRHASVRRSTACSRAPTCCSPPSVPRPSGGTGHATVSLAESVDAFAAPLRHGLTGLNSVLGGAHPGYDFYRASDGWLGVAALEPHFWAALLHGLALHEGSGGADVATKLATESAAHWAAWARERGLPIVIASADERSIPADHHPLAG